MADQNPPTDWQEILTRLCGYFERIACGELDESHNFTRHREEELAQEALKFLAQRNLIPLDYRLRRLEELKGKASERAADYVREQELQPYERYFRLYGEWPPDSESYRQRYEERERELEERFGWMKQRREKAKGDAEPE